MSTKYTLTTAFRFEGQTVCRGRLFAQSFLQLAHVGRKKKAKTAEHEQERKRKADRTSDDETH